MGTLGLYRRSSQKRSMHRMGGGSITVQTAVRFALGRMSHDERTQSYVAWRTAEDDRRPWDREDAARGRIIRPWRGRRSMRFYILATEQTPRNPFSYGF